jgi:hypothetical protein
MESHASSLVQRMHKDDFSFEEGEPNNYQHHCTEIQTSKMTLSHLQASTTVPLQKSLKLFWSHELASLSNLSPPNPEPSQTCPNPPPTQPNNPGPPLHYDVTLLNLLGLAQHPIITPSGPGPSPTPLTSTPSNLNNTIYDTSSTQPPPPPPSTTAPRNALGKSSAASEEISIKECSVVFSKGTSQMIQTFGKTKLFSW